MQFNLTIDKALIKKARTLTGLRSDRELVEFGLRALIRSKGVESQRHSLQDQDDDEVGTNPITALLESDFIACAMLDDTSLSRNYTDELTAILEKQHSFFDQYHKGLFEVFELTTSHAARITWLMKKYADLPIIVMLGFVPHPNLRGLNGDPDVRGFPYLPAKPRGVVLVWM